MDVSQYLEIFIDETKEHLQTLSDQLMILEQEPENMDTINEIFRAAHSLKGMAGTMGYKRMQRLTHDMENVFQEIRSGNMKVQPELVDVLFRGLDALEGYLANILESADEGTEENEDIINTLNEIVEKGTGKVSQTPEVTAQETSKQEETAAPAGGAGNVKIEAGAAGKVFKIESSVGASVKKGDTILVLEIMKMETPVVATEDGTVASINVSVGDMVEAGALLATLNN